METAPPGRPLECCVPGRDKPGRGKQTARADGPVLTAETGGLVMKWWKLALAVTIVGAAMLLLAGREDIARYRRMRAM